MVIEKVDFLKEALAEEYYECTFRNCDFHGLKITETKFECCTFEDCNLSLTAFFTAVFDSQFKNCHMIGCDLSGLNIFSNGLEFQGCNLNYANFEKLKLKGLKFKDCTMVEASFEEATIQNAVFDDCDLDRTVFEGADLSRCNLAEAYNFAIDPTATRLKKAIFAKDNLEGLVAHLDIVIK